VRSVSRPLLYEWSDERSAEVRDARSAGADNGDVSVVREFGEGSVVFLEYAEGEGEAPEEGFEDEGGE